MVRYFKDQVSAENTNSFFFEDGVVDVEPMRDTNGTLAGLRQSSDADFKARTEKQEEIKAEFDVAGITGNSGSFEMGDPNDCDDSIVAYTAFGVSYDHSTQKWMYDGKIIHILYDADHNTYCDRSASDELYTVDEYPSDKFAFSVFGHVLHIESKLVADAFAGLPDREQQILILDCVLELPDREVGVFVGLSRSAVQRHRTKTLNELRRNLKSKEVKN